jgi:hypothetical protein
MQAPASRRAKSLVLLTGLAIAAAAPVANAQNWYFINGQPAPPSTAQMMAARGLPFGYYWLQSNGNWGMVGSQYVMGNIYGRRPGLSERGLLYSPGELLR